MEGNKTQEQINVAIIGPGNIGTDLMYKIFKRSKYMNLKLMTGIYATSEGLRKAEELGVDIASDGIDAVLRDGSIKIAFDATTAKAHLQHATLLQEAGIQAIDLTPAAIGPYVCPVVNIDDTVDNANLNLMTCGAQATVPIVYAVSQVVKVKYAEIVATISSKSAGPGTRQNIDEFTQTTSKALEWVGNAEKGKAIIVLNPAEPPLMMRNTIYMVVEDQQPTEITRAIEEMVKRVQEYVPGYRLRIPPIYDEEQVTVMVEVEGSGDFLPVYSGNLDIETSAAVTVGDRIAAKLLGKEI